MRKSILIILVIVVIASLILVGCSSSNPATTSPNPATISTTQLAATAKPIVLKFATHALPSEYIFSKNVIDYWVKEVSDRTQGRVKITVYDSESLGKIDDEWNMLKNGVCDIGWISPSWYGENFPMSDVLDQPIVSNVRDREQTIINTLFNDYVIKEYSEVKPLWPANLGKSYIHVSKKISTLNDLKGLQIRGGSATQVAVLKALGATPASMAPPELYTGIERGTINGTTFPMDAFLSFRLYEVAKYTIQDPIGMGLVVMCMNLGTWNKLPQDIQKVFDDVSPLVQKMMLDKHNEMEDEAMAVCEKAGNEFINLSPEDLQKWSSAMAPIADQWANSLEAKGLPGKAMVAKYRELVATK